MDFAVSTYGRLDAAFNNAGIGANRTPLHLMSDDVYDAIMDTNVRGVWNCLRHEIAAMLPQGAGTIVNNSSVAGLIAIPRRPLHRLQARGGGAHPGRGGRVRPPGIRVNAVAPGTTRSEITTDWFARNPGLEEMANSATPQGRTAAPEEIAAAAAWLLSDRCPFLTGRCCRWTADWSTSEPSRPEPWQAAPLSPARKTVRPPWVPVTRTVRRPEGVRGSNCASIQHGSSNST
ncbi:SDR family oxidoreductase [Streptomyces endophytica]|uniref:SDR family oxidoreductase n=1 Tax=Streptomyces endophytica TaxID=2991496 RepID=A0ABY6P605_9ACTN|nr:SDR family oxidoreductase [Streptomyces endophytica]UZJ29216.1 SDR family oxidoreductase [Streptomyces endophytica]